MIPSTILASLLMTVLTAGSGAAAPSHVAPASGPPPSPTVTKVASMDVQIWPEYDEPRVLAIYEGHLRSTVALPTDFTFVVPEGAQPHMVGGIDAQGRHIHAEFTTRPRDDGLVEISYRLDTPTFYMEFYYDPLTGDAQRRFTFPVVTTFTVDSLSVDVQEPRRAEDFRVTPSTREVATDRDGFEYRILRFADVPAGKTTPVTVAYRKKDRKPSVTPRQPVAAASRSGPRRTTFLVLGILGVLIGFVGLYPVASERKGRKGRKGRKAGEEGHRRDALPGRFCTECGAELRPRANYCGACGRPVHADVRKGARR